MSREPQTSDAQARTLYQIRGPVLPLEVQELVLRVLFAWREMAKRSKQSCVRDGRDPGHARSAMLSVRTHHLDGHKALPLVRLHCRAFHVHFTGTELRDGSLQKIDEAGGGSVRGEGSACVCAKSSDVMPHTYRVCLLLLASLGLR